MTTIIGTKRALYSDSQASLNNDTVYLSPKIRKIGDDLLGISGDCAAEQLFLDWFPNRENEEKPKYHKDHSLIVLQLNKKGLFLWTQDFGPHTINSKYYAIGTGAQAALTAMFLGFSPEEAIEIACKIDINSSKPVLKRELDN